MYAGDLLLYAGFAWLASDGVAVAVLVLAAVSIAAQCRVEDAAMAARFGVEFERWRERTGRLLPRSW